MINGFRIQNSKLKVQVAAWIFALLIFSTPVFAQDFKRQYKNAKELFDEKKYSLAMEAFKALIVYDKENPYSEYASYFYALSANESGYPAVAKDMLLQIKKLYPTWDQLDEVNFRLAKIYFDQREYFQALLVLKSIQSPSFKQDVEAMEKQYISQIEDAETLKMLLEEHPTNSVVAYSLIKSLSAQPIYQQDMRVVDSLITRFSFNRNDFVSLTKPLSIKKDRYRVSLLFPFLAKSLEPTPGTKPN
ncbi:MAG TPA: tetratricopeptide repeat protein, partial [Cyclobacteriaceae bacterium]